MDEGYSFTIEDRSAPRLLAAQAIAQKLIKAAFDEPVEVSDTNGFLLEPLTRPAVTPLVVEAMAHLYERGCLRVGDEPVVVHIPRPQEGAADLVGEDPRLQAVPLMSPAFFSTKNKDKKRLRERLEESDNFVGRSQEAYEQHRQSQLKGEPFRGERPLLGYPPSSWRSVGYPWDESIGTGSSSRQRGSLVVGRPFVLEKTRLL